MKGRYKYLKTKTIAEVMADKMLSDYFGKQEGTWWQPSLLTDYVRTKPMMDEMMARFPTDKDREVVTAYFGTSKSQGDVAGECQVSLHKVRQLTKYARQQMLVMISMI